MGIRYSIDRSKGIILETWEGDVTAADLGAYWRSYLADPEVMSLRRTLVDLRNGTPAFSGAELDTLIHAVVLPALGGKSWRSALLVARPDQFGVCRQYSVFAERYSRDAIFEDEKSALDWLLQR